MATVIFELGRDVDLLPFKEMMQRGNPVQVDEIPYTIVGVGWSFRAGKMYGSVRMISDPDFDEVEGERIADRDLEVFIYSGTLKIGEMEISLNETRPFSRTVNTNDLQRVIDYHLKGE